MKHRSGKKINGIKPGLANAPKGVGVKVVKAAVAGFKSPSSRAATHFSRKRRIARQGA